MTMVQRESSPLREPATTARPTAQVALHTVGGTPSEPANPFPRRSLVEGVPLGREKFAGSSVRVLACYIRIRESRIQVCRGSDLGRCLEPLQPATRRSF